MPPRSDGAPAPSGRVPHTLRLAALALASSVAVAAGFGVGFVLRDDGAAGAADMQPFALYLTDAPAALERLDVRVKAVFVGDGIRVPVVRESFDLAALHGPRDALLVAQGDIPRDAAGGVRIQFAAATATVAGVQMDLPTPPDLLLEALDPTGIPQAALLDINLTESVVETRAGLAFEPRAALIYAVHEVAADAVPDFTQVTPVVPRPADLVAGVREAEGAVAGTAAGAGAAAADAVRDAAHILDLDDVEVQLDPALAAALEQATHDGATGWLVHFADETPAGRIALAVEGTGAVLVHTFRTFPIAYVLANPPQVETLRQAAEVIHLEADAPLTFFDAESKAAIRQPQVVDPVAGLRDRLGNPVDGRGVGVAVVDTGIDTLHPDLQMAPAGPVAANVQIQLNRALPAPYTDTSGHGTHVAAIVAGAGVEDPSVKGVAPGAKLYGVGAAAGHTIVWAAQALEWIVENHAAQEPPIRVVTNSWGSGTAYDPDAAITRYVNALVDRNIVVVFAAGNSGGDGSAAQTSAQCQIPRAGVVCVAAFNDLGTGTRDGLVSDSSSRGAAANSATWPDISAPGSAILSARPPAGVRTGAGLNLHYVELSGTSQAAPHVAAVAAMMLQKQPNMNPAAVEANLKSTAYKFTDGGPYASNGSHFAKGHGLLDAYAAVQSVG